MGRAALPWVVVGAGPSGTSAALALRQRGLPVLLLDAGVTDPATPPVGSFLEHRFSDRQQWRWLIGARGEALGVARQTSPKLRVPAFHALFDGYAEANRLQAESGFQLVGARAAGGMSIAWGCGVARFLDSELGALRAERVAMDAAYTRVAQRVGISGASEDPLSEELGLDRWCGPPLPLDALHQHLWDRRLRLGGDIRLGRARVAVIGAARADRSACDLSGLCLWGCPNRATWSAAHDVQTLRSDPGVRYEGGVRVDSISLQPDGSLQLCVDRHGEMQSVAAQRVLLAAGTLASTRLAWSALRERPASLRLQSNPMAAFLLLLPALLGRAHQKAFGLAQLSHQLQTLHGVTAFGNLFSTAGLPLSEFAQHLPIGRRAGIPLLRSLLPAMVVGNLFLPGSLSMHRLLLDADGRMRIAAGMHHDVDAHWRSARGRLAREFRRLGGWMLPGSFAVGAPGGDLHYAATFPHAAEPGPGESSLDGQLGGLPGLHLVDGSVLPELPSKPHTLTLMANADRIARQIPA